MADTQNMSVTFSPLVSRQAISNARDWTYLETWLMSKLNLSKSSFLPVFERNAGTLGVLRALAANNEIVDEEKAVLFEVENAALRDLKDHESQLRQKDQNGLREDLMGAIAEEMATEGHSALDGMAQMALSAEIVFPNPQNLGKRWIELQTELCDMDTIVSRAETLHYFIDDELAKAEAMLKQLGAKNFKASAEQTKKILQTQRQIQLLTASQPQGQSRSEPMKQSDSTNSPTLKDVIDTEARYLELLSEKRRLDTSMSRFEGLPANVGQARSELQNLKRQLHDMTSKRDAVFEGLVERESPVKGRRR